MLNSCDWHGNSDVNSLKKRVERIEKILNELKYRADDMRENGFINGYGNAIVDALCKSLEGLDDN